MATRSRILAMWLLLTTIVLLVPGPQFASSQGFQDPHSGGGLRNHGRCEQITIPMCKDMKYNMTRMPNLINHSSQKDAAVSIQEFFPLIQIGCSPLLKFFLCSLYAPMCTEQVDETLIIPACRSMCLEVKSKCEPILERFNFHWPPMLDCSKLPEKSDRTNLCMEAPRDEQGIMHHEEESIPGFPQNDELRRLLEVLRGRSSSTPSTTPSMGPHSLCPDRFVYIDKVNVTYISKYLQCNHS